MNIRTYFLIALGGALLGAASGFAWRAMHTTQSNDIDSPVQNVQQVDELPPFSYPDLDGRQRHSNEFANKVVVLNFWASWCAPCRKETPAFVELQKAFAGQVQFVGIAIDDIEPVREFADDYDMNYPVLLGDIDAVDLSRRLGNRYQGLPFTVVAGRDGRVLLRHAGGLEREQLEPLLHKLISSS